MMPDTTKRPDLLLAKPLSRRLPPDRIDTGERLYAALGAHLAEWVDSELGRGTEFSHVLSTLTNICADLTAGLLINHGKELGGADVHLQTLSAHIKLYGGLLHTHMHLHRDDKQERDAAMPSKAKH